MVLLWTFGRTTVFVRTFTFSWALKRTLIVLNNYLSMRNRLHIDILIFEDVKHRVAKAWNYIRSSWIFVKMQFLASSH